MSIIAASHFVAGRQEATPQICPCKSHGACRWQSSFAAQLDQCCESFTAIMGCELAVLLRSQGSPATQGNPRCRAEDATSEKLPLRLDYACKAISQSSELVEPTGRN